MRQNRFQLRSVQRPHGRRGDDDGVGAADDTVGGGKVRLDDNDVWMVGGPTDDPRGVCVLVASGAQSGQAAPQSQRHHHRGQQPPSDESDRPEASRQRRVIREPEQFQTEGHDRASKDATRRRVDHQHHCRQPRHEHGGHRGQPRGHTHGRAHPTTSEAPQYRRSKPRQHRAVEDQPQRSRHDRRPLRNAAFSSADCSVLICSTKKASTVLVSPPESNAAFISRADRSSRLIAARYT